MLINSGQNNDITLGKYGITVTVGPATVTKRQLAAEQMMAFVNAVPETAAQVMDLVAEAQDWPKADEFARRFRMALPPGMVPEDEMTPEQIAGQQQMQQVQQLQQQLAQSEQEAKIAKMQADAENATARANLALAQAYKAQIDADAKMMDTESKVEDREHQQVMGAVEQHNKLVGEDRDFDDRKEERNTRNGERTS
jgi:hypothetical protein